MKCNRFKWVVVALVSLTWASAMHTPSSAERPFFLDLTAATPASSGGASTGVGMNAEFMTAATFSIEHEPMTMKKPEPAIDINHIVTREAYVTIGGLPGETVFLTCNVSNTREAHTSIRDCGGAPAVTQDMILSGQKLDKGILLTNDLMPNDAGKSESTVTFEVSYL